MRWSLIMVVLVACVKQPPRPREHMPVTHLRATLARANIKLRLTGGTETAGCRPDAPPEARTCTRCAPVGTTGVNRAVLEVMTTAFARYPTSALSAVQIDHVAVCGSIAMTGPGGDDYGPTAVADSYGRGVLVDVNRVENPLLPWYDQIMGSSGVDEVLHHEIYHLLENAHSPALMVEDTEWDALNLLGFHYTSANYGEDLIPGFINSYAMTRVAEDKAIVYGRLMSNPRFLCELAKEDEVLRAKIALVRRRATTMMGRDDFIPAPCVATLAGG